MADNKEQRTIEIIVQAQQANASIKEMGAGAAVMSAQLRKMSQDDPGRAALLADLQGLNLRLRTANAEMRGVAKSQAELEAETLAAAEALEKQEKEAAAAAAAVEELARANEQAVTTGKKATASLTEMKAAASLLEKELANMSQDDPRRAALQREFTVLTGRIGEASTAMRTHIKTEEELAEEQRQLAAATDKLNQENIQVVVNGKKVAATYNEIKAAAEQLEKELKDLPANTEAFVKKSKELSEMKARMEAVNTEMAGMQKSGALAALGIDGVTSAAGLMKYAFQAAMAALLPLLALSKIWEMVQAFGELVQEVDKVRVAVNTATGETGPALESLTARVRALAETFGGEYNEQLKAADVLAKQMGVSHEEAFDLMEKGYLAGADRSGEFLDNVKEYAVQFKAAGYSAAEFIDYVSNAEMQGIFSDKGADVVKEFGLRIREQTVATRDALDAAFGQEFTNRIFGGIKDGSMTVKQALAEVSAAMNDTRVPANKLQTVVADVFGGPGEDAGTAFLQSLHNVGKELDTTTTKTNAYTLAQQEMLQANKDLAEAQGELTKAFSGTGNGISTYWKEFKAGLYTALAQGIEGLDSLAAVGAGSIAALKSWGSSFVEVFSSIGNADWGAARKALANIGEDSAKAYSDAYYSALSKAQEVHEGAAAAEEARRKKQKKDEVTTPSDVKTDGNTTRQDDEKAEKEAHRRQLAEAKKHAADLKKLRDEAAKEVLATTKNLEDLRVGLFLDANEREIQEISLDTDRKMAALKGSNEQIAEQWELLEQQRQDKINVVRQRQRDEEQAQREEDAATAAEQQAATDEQQIAYWERSVAAGVMAEQDYQNQLYEIQKMGLERRLADLVANGKSQTAEAKKIRTALINGETDHINAEKKLQLELKQFKQSMVAAGAALLSDALSFLVDNLNKQSTAYTLFKAVMKAAQLAEIGINLAGELSNNAKVVSSPANPLSYIPGGAAVQLGIMNGLSIGRSVLAGIRVAAFAEGGPTNQLANLMPLDMLAGLVSGASGGSFAGGGSVGKATIGLIGEAGPELVIPNWLYADPKQANLMGFLEAQIASRGNAFATGGSTTGSSPVAVAPGEDAGSEMLELMRQLVRSNAEFREEIGTWARELEVNLDPRKAKAAIDVATRVQSGGGLK